MEQDAPFDDTVPNALFEAIRSTKNVECREDHSRVLWELAEMSADSGAPDVSLWALDALWEIERPIARLEEYIANLERHPILASRAIDILAREPSEERRMSFDGLRDRARRAGSMSTLGSPLAEATGCSMQARMIDEITDVRQQISFLLELCVGNEWWTLTAAPQGPVYFHRSSFVLRPPNPTVWYSRHRLRELSKDYSLEVAEGLVDFPFRDHVEAEGQPSDAPHVREWLASHVLTADCARKWRELQED